MSAATNKTRVYVVQKGEITGAEPLASVLNQRQEIEIVGHLDYTEATTLLSAINSTKPTVVLFSVNILSERTFQPVKIVREQVPNVSFVILAGVFDIGVLDTIREYVRSISGGFGLFSKHDIESVDQLVAIISKVSIGRVVLDPGLSEELRAKTISIDLMTQREQEILDWMAKGFRNSDIADILGLEDKTVERHVNHIYDILKNEIAGSKHARVSAVSWYLKAREHLNEDPTPPEVVPALTRFRRDHPDTRRVGFIMMPFHTSKAHENILKAVKRTLDDYGLAGVRADDKAYADDLLTNIRAYLYGCGFGIAVFERLTSDDFNPNVSLEVGHLIGVQKPVCLLKDQTLRTLPTDLVGRLYVTFDPQDPLDTIPISLKRWLLDKGLI